MSHLREVPGLIELKQKYNLTIFVETGCGDGDGLTTARGELGFDKGRCFSCDLNMDSVMRCADLGNVSAMNSTSFLKEITPKLKSPTMFWLDAHFPEKFGAAGDKWPLPQELQILRDKHGIEHDVIICDDMHCIQDTANPTRFRPTSEPRDWEPVTGTLQSLVSILSWTHSTTLHAVSTGILVFEPRVHHS